MIKVIVSILSVDLTSLPPPPDIPCTEIYHLTAFTIIYKNWNAMHLHRKLNDEKEGNKTTSFSPKCSCPFGQIGQDLLLLLDHLLQQLGICFLVVVHLVGHGDQGRILLLPHLQTV